MQKPEWCFCLNSITSFWGILPFPHLIIRTIIYVFHSNTTKITPSIWRALLIAQIITLLVYPRLELVPVHPTWSTRTGDY